VSQPLRTLGTNTWELGQFFQQSRDNTTRFGQLRSWVAGAFEERKIICHKKAQKAQKGMKTVLLSRFFFVHLVLFCG
jgi:hypothetical protein